MNLLEEFKKYLFSQSNPPSKVTVKNYLSDINHFTKWFESKFQKNFDPEAVNNLTIENYKIENKEILSPASLERHLSSLRKFFYFLTIESKITKNPFTLLSKPQDEHDPWHLKDFKNFLYIYNASHLTIKNYIIDVKQFLNWAEEVSGSSSEVGANVFDEINPSLLEEYKKRLSENGRFSASSINRKLSSLRKYLAWALEQNYLSPFDLGISNINNKSPEPKFIEEKAFTQLPKLEENPIVYSQIPPVKLAQKVTKGIDSLVEAALISSIVKGIETSIHLAWKVKGQPIFDSAKKIRLPRYIAKQDIFGVRNISKEIYAPLSLSTANMPLYKKLFLQARYQRPKWYKAYHSYAITHYFHFVVLMIFIAGLALGFYNGFVKSSNPGLAANPNVPTNPLRILSFQGRLTDNTSNPITSSTNLRFAIYRDLTGTGAGTLLWQEVDQVAPDQDGIFNVVLGNTATVCANPNAAISGKCAIYSSLFSENNALWLGVTVESTGELTPRQPIATVAYAVNSETLQGLLPITATAAAVTNVVLALDSTGNLTIGSGATTANPVFSANGNFTISTGTSNGNILLYSDADSGVQIGSALSAAPIAPLFVNGGIGNNAALIVNNKNSGNLITASSAGVTKFVIDSSGNIATSNYTTIGQVLYGSSAVGALSQTTGGSTGNCLTYNSGSAPTWASCSNAASWWNQVSGLVYPTNTGWDFAVGGSATTSALFSYTGIKSGQTQASVSGNLIVIANNGYGGNVGIGTIAPTSELTFGENGTTSRAISVLARSTNAAGTPLSISAGSAGSGGTGFAGGNLTLTAGSAAGTSGNANGGDVILRVGNSVNSGTIGRFVVKDAADQQYLLLSYASPTVTLTCGALGSNPCIYKSGSQLLLASNNSYLAFQSGTSGNTEFARMTNAGLWGFNTTTPLASVDIRANTTSGGTIAVASVSGKTSFASLVANNDGVGDAFTASSSGLPLVTISNSGTVAIGAYASLPVPQGNGLVVSGNVGIGTNSPATDLHIFASGANLAVQDSSASTATLILGTSNNVGNQTIGSQLQSIRTGSPAGSNDLAFSVSLGSTMTERMRLTSGGFLGLNTSSPLATLDIRGNLGTIANASVSGKSSFASLVANNDGVGDLFSASASGYARFTITNAGGIGLGPNGTNVGTSAQCLLGGSSASWGSCGTSSANWWNQVGGLVYPVQNAYDFAVGGNSTASATFAVINNITSYPTATTTALLNVANDLRRVSPVPIATISGRTNTVVLSINNNGIGDLITASNGGNPKFTVDRNGGVIVTGAATNGINFNNTGIGTDINLRNNDTISNTAAGTIAISPSTLTASSLATFTTSATLAFATAATNLTIGATSGSLNLQNPAINVGSGSTTTVSTTSNAILNISAGSGTLNLNTVSNGAVTTGTGLTTLGGVLSITGTSGTAINISNTGIGTDINLQNGETIDNDTNNTINLGYGAAGGILLLTSSTNSVINASARLDLQVDGSVDVNIAGGNGSTGCTVTNTTGALACSGTISSGGTALTQYWQRIVGNLSPVTLNDTISATSAAATVATHTTNNPTGTLTANTLIQHTGAGTVTNLLQLTRTAGTVTTGLNLTGTMGTDISLQNSESIINSTDNTINLSYGAANGILLLTSATAGNLTFSTAGNINTTGALTLQPTGNIVLAPTTTNDVVYNPIAGQQVLITQTTSAPTSDMVAITNAGLGVTTAGVNGLSINYVGGSAAVEAGALRVDVTSGATSGSTWDGLRSVAASVPGSGVTLNLVKIEGPTSTTGTTNGILIGSGTQAFTNAINIASTGVVTDINLQNGETIDNDTDNQIQLNLGASGTLLLTSTTLARINSSTTLNINTSNTISSSIGNSTGTITLTASGITANTNSVLYSGASGVLGTATTASSGLCLMSNSTPGNPSWQSCPAGSGSGVNWWNQVGGLVYPTNTGWDFAIGGTSTASAQFAVLNMNNPWTIATIAGRLTVGQDLRVTSPTPIASISGRTNTVILSVNNNGSGDLFTASRGGNTKFVIAGSGFVGIGTSLPQAQLDIAGSTSTISNTSGDITITPTGNLVLGSGKFTTGDTYNDLVQLTVGTGSSASGNVRFQVTASQNATAAGQIWNAFPNKGTGNCASSQCHTALSLKLGTSGSTSTPGSADRFVNFARGNGFIMGSIRGNNSITTATVVYATNGGDYAEWFKKANPNDVLNPGDLVCVNSNGNVVKCDNYNTKMIGVISDSYGVIGNEKDEYLSDPNYVVVGLLGQIKTQISTENGNIQPGDMLTNSSTAGYATKATKAGPVIGKALQNGSSGKILAYINPTWYDPDIFISDTGNLNIATQAQNYAVTNNGNVVDRIGVFASNVVGNLQAGLVNAKDITTNTLSVATENIKINGVNIKDYISSVVNDVLNSGGYISPLDTSHGIAIYDQTTGAKVASIDTQGNASFSGTLNVQKDATIAGTLRAKKIIADEIEGLNVKTSTVSASYITNVTNIYNSTDFPTIPTTPATPSGTNFFADLFVGHNYVSIATFSSQLAYVDNLYAGNATFANGLSVYGPSTLSDTSIVGQLSIGGSLILSDNSVNVLGSDLNLQPLRQGGLSIMAGLIYIDTNGNMQIGQNLTVNGTLYAKNISSTGDDLNFNLSSDSANLNIKNATGSSLLTINNKGDLVSSGAGTFNKLNIGNIVGTALAVSPTEIIATGSAGTASIQTGRTEITIDNKLVTSKSLIYITPTTSTPQTLFLLRQVPNTSFTVGIQTPEANPVKFNWIIIN